MYKLTFQTQGYHQQGWIIKCDIVKKHRKKKECKNKMEKSCIGYRTHQDLTNKAKQRNGNRRKQIKISLALSTTGIRNSNLHHPIDVLKGNPSMIITC